MGERRGEKKKRMVSCLKKTKLPDKRGRDVQRSRRGNAARSSVWSAEPTQNLKESDFREEKKNNTLCETFIIVCGTFNTTAQTWWRPFDDTIPHQSVCGCVSDCFSLALSLSFGVIKKSGKKPKPNPMRWTALNISPRGQNAAKSCADGRRTQKGCYF